MLNCKDLFYSILFCLKNTQDDGNYGSREWFRKKNKINNLSIIKKSRN